MAFSRSSNAVPPFAVKSHSNSAISSFASATRCSWVSVAVTSSALDVIVGYHTTMKRKATLEDAVALAELEAVCFPENNFNETTLANELVAGEGWLYFVDGQLVGYLLARHDADLTDITRVGVHPLHRNRGVGTALLEEALANSTAVMLTVRKDNTNALRLYIDHGFRIVGYLAEGTGWVLRRQSHSA